MVKMFSVLGIIMNKKDVCCLIVNNRKRKWLMRQAMCLFFRSFKIVELVILFYIIISDEISTFQHFHKCRKLIFFSLSQSNFNRNKRKMFLIKKKRKSWPTIIDTCVLIQLMILIFDENQRNRSASIVLWRKKEKGLLKWIRLSS